MAATRPPCARSSSGSPTTSGGRACRGCRLGCSSRSSPRTTASSPRRSSPSGCRSARRRSAARCATSCRCSSSAASASRAHVASGTGWTTTPGSRPRSSRAAAARQWMRRSASACRGRARDPGRPRLDETQEFLEYLHEEMPAMLRAGGDERPGGDGGQSERVALLLGGVVEVDRRVALRLRGWRSPGRGSRGRGGPPRR